MCIDDNIKKGFVFKNRENRDLQIKLIKELREIQQVQQEQTLEEHVMNKLFGNDKVKEDINLRYCPVAEVVARR